MPDRSPISYRVRFPEPHSNSAEVEARVPTDGQPSTELRLAVWTPGSYLVREYSRCVDHVSAVDAETRREIPVLKTRKNRWRFDTKDVGELVVRYRLYCHEMSVRSNWVETSFALINGAPSFLTSYDGTPESDREHHVAFELPETWKRVDSSLDRQNSSGKGSASETVFVAHSYDELVDSPFVAGNPAVYDFECGGRAHQLINIEEGGIWDGETSSRDVERIVNYQHQFWGSVPYKRYVFFNLITESGGGLEHKDSTVLMTSRWKSKTRSGYLDWLGLVNHEFFHTWNVKRLRPIELGPFDYENEVYTRSLWVAEGITNYYTDLLLCRAELCTEEEYLEKLSKFFERLHATPGRRTQNLEESSFDAWIRLYRPDENTVNSTISYYVKGAVVAFLLDVIIRRATDNQQTLDDVMREAFKRFSADGDKGGFRAEQFCDLAGEIAGTDLSSWFETTLRTTEELDYSEALEWFGLRFGKTKEKKRPKESQAYLGIVTKNTGGRLVVSRVLDGTPSHRHDVNTGDEILAIDDFRVPADKWEKRLGLYQPGDHIELLIARRERILRVKVELGERPQESWQLRVDSNASDLQKENRRRWLNAE